MKKLLPLLIMAVIASCAAPKYYSCPKYVGIAIDTIPIHLMDTSHGGLLPVTIACGESLTEAVSRLSFRYSKEQSLKTRRREYMSEYYGQDQEMRRILHCIVFGDTLQVKVEPFFDSLFTKAKVIQAGGKVFRVDDDPASELWSFNSLGTFGVHIDSRWVKPDTTCEWMHISMRDVGFVIIRKALAVRRNGYCIAHLAADKTPLPVHWHVGWCQGKDSLFNRLLGQLN